jgi:hypothetical protein
MGGAVDVVDRGGDVEGLGHLGSFKRNRGAGVWRCHNWWFASSGGNDGLFVRRRDVLEQGFVIPAAIEDPEDRDAINFDLECDHGPLALVGDA